MNIFASSESAVESAKALDDVRLRKMIVESAQMLCTTLRLKAVSGNYSELAELVAGAPELYKAAYDKHPCTLWVAADWNNWGWLYQHWVALSWEYLDRFGKPHLTHSKLKSVLHTAYEATSAFRPLGLSERSPKEFIYVGSLPPKGGVHESYRALLLHKWAADAAKRRPPRWTNTTPPAFYLSTLA